MFPWPLVLLTQERTIPMCVCYACREMYCCSGMHARCCVTSQMHRLRITRNWPLRKGPLCWSLVLCVVFRRTRNCRLQHYGSLTCAQPCSRSTRCSCASTSLPSVAARSGEPNVLLNVYSGCALSFGFPCTLCIVSSYVCTGLSRITPRCCWPPSPPLGRWHHRGHTTMRSSEKVQWRK